MLPVSPFPAAGLPRFHAVLHGARPVLVARLQRTMAHWRQRRVEQAVCRTLRELDDHTLHDLGIDRSEIGPALLYPDPTRVPRIRAEP